MTRDAVEYLYGDTNDGTLRIEDDYVPPGTKCEAVATSWASIEPPGSSGSSLKSF